MTSTHYDVLVIGSGFGGSVTAMRLAEKGYRASGCSKRASATTPTTCPPRPGTPVGSCSRS